MQIPKEGDTAYYIEWIERFLREEAPSIEPLRGAVLTGDDVEVRLWTFSLFKGSRPENSLYLSRRGGAWSAGTLSPWTKGAKGPVVFPPPVSGWREMWWSLTAQGLLNMRDESELRGRRAEVYDGGVVAVEVAQHGRYRIYSYNNPGFNTHWPEAWRMIRIEERLEWEFPAWKPR